MHPRSRFFIGIGITTLAVLIAVLNQLAFSFSLYWTLWWFDIVMHILGGFFIGVATLWLIRYEVPIGLRPLVPRRTVLAIIFLLIALSWEVFEYGIQTYSREEYIADTTLDLLVGALGASAAWVLLKRL